MDNSCRITKMEDLVNMMCISLESKNGDTERIVVNAKGDVVFPLFVELRGPNNIIGYTSMSGDMVVARISYLECRHDKPNFVLDGKLVRVDTVNSSYPIGTVDTAMMPMITMWIDKANALIAKNAAIPEKATTPAHKITVEKLKEAGITQSIMGTALPFNVSYEQASKAVMKLAHKDGGHNKFLEGIVTWWMMALPRYLWQQFDTYRVGVTKQSESTMHTLMRRNLIQDDFVVDIYEPTLDRLNALIDTKNFEQAKAELPEGFLQRRMVCMNYKTIRNMILQRRNHKLQEWKMLLRAILDAIDHPDLLPSMSTSGDCPKSGKKTTWSSEKENLLMGADIVS
jgi:hypothetical protein